MKRSILGLAVAAGMLAVVSVAHGVTYNVTNLGALGGNRGQANGINASGQVVGYAEPSGSYSGHAFSYDGAMHDLGNLGAGGSLATDVNASGQIVGSLNEPGGYMAYRYDGAVHPLGTLGGQESMAAALNDSGQVVGWSWMYGTYGAQRHGYIYDGTMHDLGTLGGPESYAVDINNKGQVVGMSQVSNRDYHAYFYDGTMHDLDQQLDPSGLSRIGNASAINDNGWIAGYGLLNGNTQAYLYDGATLHFLGTVGGYPYSLANGINAHGQVVGEAFADGAYTNCRAFLYDGTTHDLNDLIDPASGWTILSAQDINDNGWIAAWGTNSANPSVVQALLLTPIPEPTTLGILGVGVFGMLAWRRK